jgi:tRNA G18 (ribose-2'-O)-methylase SpoU
MHGSGHSLNVAIACAVVLYEVGRRHSLRNSFALLDGKE